MRKISAGEYPRTFGFYNFERVLTEIFPALCSTWLRSTQRGKNALGRWTWCVGLVMLLAVVGGSVACWWFTRSNPAHAIPVAIGGGASETMGASTTIPTPVNAGPATTSAVRKPAQTQTKKAVSAAPTTTAPPRVKRTTEELVAPTPTSTPPVRRGKRNPHNAHAHAHPHAISNDLD